jgi:hypothetical protein
VDAVEVMRGTHRNKVAHPHPEKYEYYTMDFLVFDLFF